VTYLTHIMGVDAATAAIEVRSSICVQSVYNVKQQQATTLQAQAVLSLIAAAAALGVGGSRQAPAGSGFAAATAAATSWR
jgi:hypothetical protein